MDITLPIRIFSVDPATGYSGWSLLELVSLNPLEIRVLHHGQLEGQKLLRTKKEMSGLFQKQFCILDALYDEYVKLLTLYNPDIVVSEGAFGYKHLSALISLTLAINTLRRASRACLNKDIVEIPPTITKKAFTGSGNADKDAMRVAYYDNTYLVRTGIVDITEHEIDAIAHGCSWVMRDILHSVEQNHAKDKKKKK